MSTEGVPADLRGDGLLWLLNATALHPRGFALAINTATGDLTLLGDGSEPWVFGDHTGDEPFEAVEALFERAAATNRSDS